jgi:hypothetical protein
MAAGDVTVQVVKAEASIVDTALTAIRASAGATGKYGMVSIQNGQYVLIWGIEEA